MLANIAIFRVPHSKLAPDDDGIPCIIESIELGCVENLAHFTPGYVQLRRQAEFFELIITGIAIKKEGVKVDIWIDIILNDGSVET